MKPKPFSPDASLVNDESFVATSRRGLTYPLGEAAPEPGAVLAVAPGVGWLRLPMPGSLAHINVWALDDGDGFTIVDTGIPLPDSRDVWKQAFAGPLAGRQATRVICTHLHPDHVGLAGWLCRKFDVDLWMTREEWLTVRMLVADARDEVPEEMVAFWRGAGWDDAQIAAASARGWGRLKDIVSRLPLGYRRIVDGEVIAIGGRDWRVVVGSGHSPEHACLWQPELGVLIAGDQVLPQISSNISLGVTEPHADPLGDWLTSIAKLKAILPADTLVLPAHGEPFTGLHTRLDALDHEHRRRLDMVHEHLFESRRAVDCFGRMFRRTIGDDMLGLATGETLAHLRRLEVQGRAVRDVLDGVWWFRQA